MRYSRALPRERRPLHNTVQDVGDVHRGEHTLKFRCALCVVRREIARETRRLQTPLSPMTRAANATPQFSTMQHHLDA
jgi:hypothetical protein